MNEDEASVFSSLLHPDDIYDENGTYWADLPLRQRIKFVRKVDAEETKTEIEWIISMFKQNPLSLISYYFKNMVLPGAGLGLEG